jgi:hypothetical protein
MTAELRMRPTPNAIAAAAGSAPSSPGVYFFLSRKRDVLYIGMAKDLRRRLRQHANAPRDALYRRVSGVRWEELPDEDAAAAREADLIVALQPPYNAAIAGEGRWTYVHVAPRTAGRLRFILSSGLDATKDARVYGCFPHLGAGVGSLPGTACSDGYSAFLRLAWAASGEGTHYPGRITRGTPPESFDVALAPDDLAPLHAFLSGTSRRLLPALSVRAWRRHPYMHPGIARDYRLAGAFFDFGPKAIRDLRRRHGLPRGPLAQHVIEQLLTDEVASITGAPCGEHHETAAPAREILR